MRIIVTGGGTAGHVTPLLAVVSKITQLEPTAEVRYIGQFGDNFSKELVLKDGNITKIYSIFAGKFRRFHGKSISWYLANPSIILKNVRDIVLVKLGIIQSVFVLIAWRPDAVFVKGGYVGLPVGLAAAFLRIPIITHDSDAIPGLTNRILARFSTKQAVALPAENYIKYYKAQNIVVTGVPISNKFVQINHAQLATVRQTLGFSATDKIVVFVGGSLGAERLNEAILIILPKLLKDTRVKIVWATGHGQYKDISDKLLVYRTSVNIMPFFDNLAEYFSVANVVVSRSGATTIAELAAARAPTILVPNPVLTGGHQLINAQVIINAKACLATSENHDETDAPMLLANINKILDSPQLASKLSKNIATFHHQDSAKQLALVVVGVAK